MVFSSEEQSNSMDFVSVSVAKRIYVRFSAQSQLVAGIIVFQNGKIMNVDHDVFVRSIPTDRKTDIYITCRRVIR